MAKRYKEETVHLQAFAIGGQAIGELANGKKIFVWGGLPGEEVVVRLTKQKSKWAEGVVTEVLSRSPDRIDPKDAESYLSTSPWQILDESKEDTAKHALVKEAFLQHHVDLPETASYHPTSQFFGYRNKVEFSFYYDTEADRLELGFFRRGGQGKIPVQGTSLAMPQINAAAIAIRDVLRRNGAQGRHLKTLLIRAQADGQVVAQLYVKDKEARYLEAADIAHLGLQGFQLIYSNPLSPASVITEVLESYGRTVLSDTLGGVEFTYACEGFFQVNLPVYRQALEDMARYVDPGRPTLDLYSGVGTIGLTIGQGETVLVEENPACVAEMQQNIARLHKPAHAVSASSEQALDYITDQVTVIVDPPRAGLHRAVIERLREVAPPTVVYLSCNPATQARDTALLTHGGPYVIGQAKTYNFFPRTPHIEHLVVLQQV